SSPRDESVRLADRAGVSLGMTGWRRPVGAVRRTARASPSRTGEVNRPYVGTTEQQSLRAIVMSSEAETSLSIGFQCSAVIVRDSSTLLGMTEDPIRRAFEKAVGAFAARRKFCRVDALS